MDTVPLNKKTIRTQSDLGMHIIMKFISSHSTFKAQKLIRNTNNKNLIAPFAWYCKLCLVH